MEEHLLVISEYNGEGYRPLIDFESWRVAILRWEPGLQAEEIEFMERHSQTDEVFVLMHGWATLLIGGDQVEVDSLQAEEMESGKLYNVKQNAWHTVLLSRDASILIVENRDTSVDNSEYFRLTEEHRRVISGMAIRQQGAHGHANG
jgi:ureidoglycolate hydrolase